jgi:hypothetical protein
MLREAELAPAHVAAWAFAGVVAKSADSATYGAQPRWSRSPRRHELGHCELQGDQIEEMNAGDLAEIRVDAF